MIVYLEEDGAYLAWVQRHRHGFVLDWRRQPTRKVPMLHRATCADIRLANKRKTHWTTGRRLKACATSIEELKQWVQQTGGSSMAYCESCTPEAESPPQTADHITKMGRDIVDFVLEAAVIHLDRKDAAYQLNVSDIAKAVEKTPGQIRAAVIQLVESDYLRLDERGPARNSFTELRRVFPTAKALRTLPAFASLSHKQIQTELAGLSESNDGTLS